jgi:RNA polymerase sigma-32 factor
MGFVEPLSTVLVRAARSAPILEAAHEVKLAQRWRDRREGRAIDELVQSHLRLVIKLAVRYRSFGLPLSDLVQEGAVGLMQAADRFDPERGVRFSTYAAWWIKAAIQDYVLKNWSIVRLGTTSSQKSLFLNLRRLRARMGESDRDLSPEMVAELVAAHGVSARSVGLTDARIRARDVSLDAPLSDGSSETHSGQIPDPGATPEEIVADRRDRQKRAQWLSECLAELPPRERAIVVRRQLADAGVTLETLGKELGISKERVRQLEARAIGKLRTALARRSDSLNYVPART